MPINQDPDISKLNFSLLSDRESELLSLVAKGLLDKQIADRLGISVNTLRTYWNRIRSKLGDHSRAGFVAAWTKQQIADQQAPSFHVVSIADSEDENDMPWERNPKTGMVLACRYLNKLAGLTPNVWHPAEAYGVNLPEDTIKEFLQIMDHAVNSGENHYSIGHQMYKGSELVDVHSFGVILRDSAGNPERILGRTVMAGDATIEPMFRLGLWGIDSEGQCQFDEQSAAIFGLSPQLLSPPHDQDCLESIKLIEESVSPSDSKRWKKLLDPKSYTEGETLAISFSLKTSSRMISKVQMHGRQQTVEGVRSVSGAVAAVEFVVQTR